MTQDLSWWMLRGHLCILLLPLGVFSQCQSTDRTVPSVFSPCKSLTVQCWRGIMRINTFSLLLTPMLRKITYPLVPPLKWAGNFPPALLPVHGSVITQLRTAPFLAAIRSTMACATTDPLRKNIPPLTPWPPADRGGPPVIASQAMQMSPARNHSTLHPYPRVLVMICGPKY